MNEQTDQATQEPKALEVVNTRVFNAPRELLFEVCSNPQHLIHWWGPSDFTNTLQEFSFHPGGKWRFVMQGPDGKQYPQDKEFVEIIPPSCIVLRHTQELHNFDMAMTFAEHAEGTQVTWRMVFEASPQNAQLESFIPKANEENFDRLAAYLKTLPAS